MTRLGLALTAATLVVGVLASTVEAYTDKQLELFLQEMVPEEEKAAFMRYAIIRGYEVTEGVHTGLYVPEVSVTASPKLLKALYKYFLKQHSMPSITTHPYPMDVICFPSGCIEINDPGVHPFN
ncbi:hypothetical protein NQ315_001179 [Exocentrus adspersus]|uniref:Uncharacterized protein n=1 Tax=Exocentrus adspersus TaxID=1586481 RepID=A0AAV8WEM0_9CUCU|nr:hypothetical protein NQ315_001179 [Exocentrus adspersus]